ncbi:MAG: SRPBCC family protein [Acetobacteraceae bacterium]
MASIRREIVMEVPPASVWSALRDVGALHTRLVPGFVTDCVFDGEARTVTFASGLSVRERIVDVDEVDMRVVWAVAGGRMSHHNASAQVLAGGPGSSKVVWIANLLPHDLAPAIVDMIEQGLAAMKRHLESANAG